MATKKKATKKKVKNGIHLKRATSGKAKGQYYWNVTYGKHVLCDSGETYHNVKDANAAMKTAHTMLADFFVLGNNKIFHDETGDVK